MIIGDGQVKVVQQLALGLPGSCLHHFWCHLRRHGHRRTFGINE